MTLVEFGLKRPVAATLVKFVLIAGGIIFGLGLTREFFPETDPTQVVVSAPYPGASPEEIQDSLAIKIEDALSDLRDIKEITTTATESAATVRIEFSDGVDIDAKVAEVKREVDALQDLPERAERIIVQKLEPNIPVIAFNISSEGDERALKDAIEQVRDDLRSLPGMGEVIVSGTRRDELAVEVRPGALLEHSISLPQVADRIRQAMIELPGGSVRSGTNTVTIRTMGAAEQAQDVRNIVVKSSPDGQVLRLSEIADVRAGFVDVEVRSRLNGRACATLTVYKVGKQDTVTISDMVKAYAAGREREPVSMTIAERLSGGRSTRLDAYRLGLSREAELPGEVTLTTDLARFVVQRLDLLSRNAMQGAFWVFLTLFLLLNWRAAFWVLMGLAVAILGTLVVMRVMDLTLNLLSMFGLIIVLGMLVDDGIVIAENIVTWHDRGEEPDHAALKATHEVMWPVFGTVTTTVFSFVPLLLIKGRIGDFLGQLPWVVACALGVSLIEALFCLPVHMAKSLKAQDRRRSAHTLRVYDRAEAWFDARRDVFLERCVRGPFSFILRRALGAPGLVTCAVVAMLVISLGMVAGGRLKFTFFGGGDSETIVGMVRMPVGTPIEQTDEIAGRLERAALDQPEVKDVFVLTGAMADLEASGSVAQTHLAQLFIELWPVEEREAKGMRTSETLTVAIRQAAGELAGVDSVSLSALQGGPSGSAITLAVAGDRFETVMNAAETLKERLAEFDGVYDISDDADTGQRELLISLRPGASELGFTTENIARQVRGAVFGIEAHTFPGRREDVDVRVRFPEAERRSLAAIESMHVFAPSGRAAPLREVAHLEEARGYATVRRLNRLRTVTVTAEVDSAVTSPEAVTAALAGVLAEIERANPGVRLLARGRQKDLADSFSTLPVGMLVALGLNYIVLCLLSGSYVQPLVIMCSIPFSIIGVVWGHIVLGYDLQMLSLIGFVALSGVVVNNAIVYMEFFNAARARGVDVAAAAHGAGVDRLRAVLLTTITTVAGLAPLILENSFQARVLIPMAITLCAGLIVSSMLVLVALPCLLVVMHRVQAAAHMVWTGRREAPETGRVPQGGA